jgi:hypothetical protein
MTLQTHLLLRPNDAGTIYRDFQPPRLRGCSEPLTVQQQYAAELRGRQ